MIEFVLSFLLSVWVTTDVSGVRRLLCRLSSVEEMMDMVIDRLSNRNESENFASFIRFSSRLVSVDRASVVRINVTLAKGEGKEIQNSFIASI